MTGSDPASLTSSAGTPDPRLPFFAYGIFSPGQIAFFQIKDHVRQITDTSATGVLRIRDGVPVLDATAQSEVANGYRIEFNGADAKFAYQAIQGMEPSTQYRWRKDGEMNVLVGYKPQRGSRPSRTITVIVAPYDQPATVEYRGELWTEAFAPGPPQFLDLSTRKRQEQGSCALIGQDSAGLGRF